jgi:hypothetical protein
MLEDASLSVDPGELVAVWGLRGSGRTTLLRLAAGIDAPDAGAVLFAGRDLAAHGEELLGREIGYVQRSFRTAAAQSAIDEVVVGLLVNGVPTAAARTRAHESLARVGGVLRRTTGLRADGAAHAARDRPCACAGTAAAGRRRARQRSTCTRDGIPLLLRSLADGIAVLMTVGELTGLGADRR